MPNPNFPQMKEELDQMPEAEAPKDMFEGTETPAVTDEQFAENVKAAQERVQTKVEESAAERADRAQTAKDVAEIKANVVRDQLENMRAEDQPEVTASQKKPFDTTLQPANEAESMMTQAQMNRADRAEAKKKPFWKFWG